MPSPPAPPPTPVDAGPCLNCATPVTGRYCPQCGQRLEQRPLGLVALLWDLLVEVLDSDARVWRTLRTLILRPGQLTNAWVEGQRVAYMPPFRLYFVLNVLAFLVVAAQAPPLATTALQAGATPNSVAAATLEQRLADLDEQDPSTPGLAGERAGLEQALAAIRQQQDAASGESTASEQAAGPGANGADLGIFEQWLVDIGYPQERVQGVIARGMADPAATLEALYERLPAVLILLLPVLATVLRVLYLFSGRPWVVHLVALVHLHAFGFLLILLVEGLQGFGLLLGTVGMPSVGDHLVDAVGVAAALAAPLYVLRWVAVVYGHHWVLAVPIAAAVGLLHLIGAAVGIVGLVVGAVFFEVVFGS